MSLPRKLARARKRAKLSQAELARRIECHRSAICELEKGVREPSLKMLRRLAAELDIELMELVA